VGDRAGEGRTLNNIGLVYDRLGQYEKALGYYQQSLILYRAIESRKDEGTALDNIGLAYGEMGELEKALDYLNQSLAIQKATGDTSAQALTLQNLALVYAKRGDLTEALEISEQSLQIEQATNARRDETGSFDNIAVLQQKLGQKEKARKSFAQALELAKAQRSLGWEARILSDLMDYWGQEGQVPAAVFFGKQSVNRIQQMRGNISGFEKDVQSSFVKSVENVYRELADLLITQGRLPEAEQVLDLLKNEEYFEFIRGDSKDSSALTATVKLTKEEEAADREYEANAERVTAIGNEYAALRAKPKRTEEEEAHLKELEQRLAVASEVWEKFLNGYFEELGKTSEANAQVENLEEHTSEMRSVLKELDPGTVALYTLVTDEKYRVMVITPNVTVPREYPIKADELRKKVAEFRQVLMDPASDPKPKAQELYNILVAPVAKELEGARATTLMWSLDGALRYLPIAALHDGHEYLVEKYRNTVFTPSSIPSLTERPNVVAWRGLGMGVSKSYAGFQALPAVPEELHRIIHEKGAAKDTGVVPGQLMLDETFTAENMEKALEDKYPLVHIASHFDFAPGNDSATFLLLGGKDEKGERLTLAELRKNPAFSFSDTELLTLSACNTAVGGAAGDGREVDGIGYVAQRRGARAVVASLWGVYDQSTGLLMEDFYKRWTTHRNMPKGEALREAQLDLLRGANAASSASGHASKGDGVTPGAAPANYSHPFYWAPFILIGNWR
jgi:CHAT domain-containing protein/Tfp pilus assembly protein PilF